MYLPIPLSSPPRLELQRQQMAALRTGDNTADGVVADPPCELFVKCTAARAA